MLHRRRVARGYHRASGSVAADRDVELGGLDPQETDIRANRTETIEQELDRWDENAEDEWDETEDPGPLNSFQSEQETTATKMDNITKETKQRND